MLKVPDGWAWDFWIAQDADQFHLYFLHAPHSLGDPGRRHRAARIGHAISTDLRTWEIVGRAFEAGEQGAFDDTATWTGCVVRGDDGLWRMFYTGSRFLHPEPEYANIETVGVAVSSDLTTWEKLPGPITRADPRWYETYVPGEGWKEEAWRDPWVFRDPSGSGWHMLVTARAKDGPLDDRGVIGHAFSPDLKEWEVLPPLSDPGAGFGHLEVPQVEYIDGQWVLVFSCGPNTLSADNPARGNDPGTWALPIAAPHEHMDVAAARPITTSSHYSGRLVQDRDSGWSLMCFLGAEAGGDFRGVISDPVPVRVNADGYLAVDDAEFDPSPLDNSARHRQSVLDAAE
jgi:beta-fructofuranosidase